ncbi:hypothetical protein FRC03_010543 [Tulasnella sp. 419]|nr:hypothetical protein FRC03_010543 [Tulasnella sp. 419]
MSLSALVNSAECGPINPLQGLTKRFEQSNGVQQDQIRVGQPGSSRQTFRSHSTQPASSIAQAAPEFLQGRGTLPTASPFDLGSLKGALPHDLRHQTPPAFHSHTPVSGWAADFMGSQSSSPIVQTPTAASSWAADFVTATQVSKTGTPVSVLAPHDPQSVTPLRASPQPVMTQPFMANPHFLPQVPQLSQPMMNWTQPMHPTHQLQAPTAKDDAWAAQFAQIEQQSQADSIASNAEQQKEIVVDDLAATAGLLVESLKDEQSEKFKNSVFMGLMKKLRDMEVVIEGNDLVPASEVADIKGKGKAVDDGFEMSGSQLEGRRKSVHFEGSQAPWMLGDNYEEGIVSEDDWQKANLHGQQRQGIIAAQTAEWGLLQDSWDELEATGVGFQTAKVVPTSSYKFQPNNPYLIGESSTRHHSLHSGLISSTYQSVLEKEAAVQRSPNEAQAWFELGVKQQENEREAKAIEALTQAVQLDPTLLEAWLALAISQTNENKRDESLNAIAQWIQQNERYKIASTKHGVADVVADESQSSAQKTDAIIQCLLEMARITPEGEIDADIQVALAVMLIAKEDYVKAQDCFKTALEVRPDDWLLFNRVGATMANNRQSEEALLYYYRALELNPNYIRARFNLGISCINLRRFEEAASHILDALVLQESESTDEGQDSVGSAHPSQRGVEPSALWDCLKTTCLQMQRHDLASLCDSKDLTRFRNEFYILNGA